jgi:protein-S-isoprenylcysteine O-methyltransferase Ste14
LSYVARIGAEETALIKVFGKQYTDWKKKSSRLFPGIW